jgi:hypothetical protein
MLPIRRPLRAARPYLVLLAAWALFFWRFAAPDPADRLTYPAGDFSQQFGVFRAIAYHALVDGRLPLWADCLYAGYPFQADPQSQLFYPPVWAVFGVLRAQGWGHFPLEALVAEVVLHYLLASLFMYWFLLSLRLGPAAAVLGAVVWTYGGYLTGFPPVQPGILETAVWLPLALLCAGRLADRARTRDLALIALVLAVAFLAGHPQTFLYSAGLALAYFALRAWQAGWRLGPIVAHGLGLAALSLALAGAQLLPSAHFIANSTRATVSFEQAGHGFPFADVLQFFITNLVSVWNPLYVGLLPLGLAALAVGAALAGRSPMIWFWVVVAMAALVLSFGTKAVAYDAAYWLVPGYRLFRSQERLALAVSLALAVLAAHGAEALLGARALEHQRALRRLLAVGAVLFALAWILLAALFYAQRLGLPVTPDLTERTGLFTLACGLALLALGAAARWPGRAWLPALFLGVVVVDLFAADRGTNVVPPYPFYPNNPLLGAIVDDGGFFRVQDDAQLAGHAGCAYGYRAIEGVAPYQVASYTRFLASAPEPVRWRLLGVRYVVTWRAELTEAGPWHQPIVVTARGDVPDEKGNVTTVHRLGSTPQRAFVVEAPAYATSDDEVYGRLADPNFDPLQTVIVRWSDPTQSPPLNEGSRPLQASVAVLRDEPGQMSLEVATSASGFLVVSEAYFPGWQARLDGQPVPVLRVDGALIGLVVPPGTHAVALAYQPPVFYAGAALSGLALVVTALLLLRPMRLPGSLAG